MNKIQREANKKKQGYNPLFRSKTCASCVFRVIHEVHTAGSAVEKKVACGLGGFWVKNHHSCNEYSPKFAEDEQIQG